MGHCSFKSIFPTHFSFYWLLKSNSLINYAYIFFKRLAYINRIFNFCHLRSLVPTKLLNVGALLLFIETVRCGTFKDYVKSIQLPLSQNLLSWYNIKNPTYFYLKSSPLLLINLALAYMDAIFRSFETGLSKKKHVEHIGRPWWATSSLL